MQRQISFFKGSDVDAVDFKKACLYTDAAIQFNWILKKELWLPLHLIYGIRQYEVLSIKMVFERKNDWQNLANV